MSGLVDALLDLVPLSHTDSVILVGAALLGALAGLVGSLAVLRQRSMVGDAMSHTALPGVCVGFLLADGPDPAALFAGALVAGLLGALAMVALERRASVPQDSATGVVLTTGFSLGILLLTYIGSRPDADQAGLDTLLFGQAAALLERDVALALVLLAGTAAVLVVLRHPMRTALFDARFGASVGLRTALVEVVATVLLVVAVVAGLRVVGAILMVSLLVAPALVARQLAGSYGRMLVVAGVTGALVGASGAMASSASSTPTGPVIVLVGTAAALLALAVAPGRGLVWQHLRRARARREAQA